MVSLEGTKADEIALLLEDDIVSGRIEPGTVLRQEQLSERFGVSRTPIREALRRLSAHGLVSFVPNRGVRVRTLSREELREAFLVRAELESLATELAVPRMTPERLAELDTAEQRFSELTLVLREKARAGKADNALAVDWMRANYRFHDVIYEAADMPYLERLAKSARRTFVGQITWVARAELDALYERNDREHRAIREAIAAGSPGGARMLAREHVLHSWELLDAILDLVQQREQALRSA
jgi:DNA-binding GntR family transcriptional regulator